MIYIAGRILGDHSKYKKLLSELRLKLSDELYLLGDMTSGNDDSIEILTDMSLKTNIFPILGDNELELLKNIRSGNKSKIPAKYDELDEDFRSGLIEYLSDMPLYDEIEHNNNKYLLVHAGIKNFKHHRSLDDYKLDELIYEHAIPEDSGYTIITAHDARFEQKMPENKSVFVLRLDDGAEFYI